MTHGNGRYFLTIIDDYFRKVWVRILKSMDEAFERFKEWKTLTQKQTGKMVTRLRIDNGLEYFSK